MSDPKLALYELEMVKKELENCIKAVNRAHDYISVNQIKSIMENKKNDKRDEIQTMIDEVLTKAYCISNFDTKFIDSLNDCYRRTNHLSDKQMEALENLHLKLVQRKKS